MRITRAQLRQIIREAVRRSALREASQPMIDTKNGKAEVTVGNDMFDFSSDEVMKLQKPGTVYDDAYDHDAEEGCMMSRDRKGGEVKVSLHKGGNTVFTDTLDAQDFENVLKELS